MQARYHYEAYGETQFEAKETGFTSSNPYQYTGRENDGNGLYHYGARYYSPISKRFTQQGPLGMVDRPNQYARKAQKSPDTHYSVGKQITWALITLSKHISKVMLRVLKAYIQIPAF